MIEFTVHVFDLRSGKRKSLSETGPATKEALRGWMGSANGIGPVVGLRLRATGDVAWIAQAYGTESMPFYEIRRREGSRIRRLAAGTDISPTSLRLSGNRLTWLQAGHASEARLGK